MSLGARESTPVLCSAKTHARRFPLVSIFVTKRGRRAIINVNVPHSSYSNNQDLHIGVTDCDGRVHAYDERGVTSTQDWTQCLVLPGLQDELNQQQWGESLLRHVDSCEWTAKR